MTLCGQDGHGVGAFRLVRRVRLFRVINVVRLVRIVNAVRAVNVVKEIRVVSMDDMLSENIWFPCPKSSNN